LIGPLVLSLLALAGAETPGVRWETRLEEALKKARTLGRPVMVDFWADWCGWCHRLDQTTYVDPVVVKLSESFVAVKVNTEGSPQEASITQRYEVDSLPSVIFLTPRGRLILRVSGFQGPGQFPATLKAARDASGQVMAFEAALEKDPRDATALAGLAVHLFEQEAYSESRELFRKAAASDAARPADERKRTRMMLAIIEKYDRDYAGAERLLREALAIQPATAHDPKVLYLLARVKMSQGRPQEARPMLQQVLLDWPKSPVAEKCREALRSLDRP
jgi:thioredoxin-like negative regulator of GroEL